MRLRFPHGREREREHEHERRARDEHAAPARHQECMCAACSGGPSPPPAPALPLAPPSSQHGRLTLTMKKEAQDSSLLATRSMRKSSEPLPDLEAYRASRTKLKSSVKARAGVLACCIYIQKAVVSDAARVLPALLAARRRGRAHQGK